MSYLSQDLPAQVRGDSWYLQFILYDSNGNLIDITGNQYWITLKSSVDDTDENAVLQVGPVQATGAEAAAGKVTIYVSPLLTNVITPARYYYDLQEITSSGSINTLMIGKVKVVHDVTLEADYTGLPPVVPEPTAIAIGEITKDMTGAYDRTQSTYSFDNSTRTYTLTPVSEAIYYYRGKKITLNSPKSIIISATPGGRYLKLNPDTEELEENPVGGFPSFTDDLLIAYVYWDGAKAIILADERHGSERDTTWQLAQHLNVGAVWRTGGELSFTLLDEANVSLDLQNITIADEDLIHQIVDADSSANPYEQILSPAASLPVMYLDGTHYTESEPDTVPWLIGSNLAYYNQIVSGNGSLVEMSNGHYVAYWMLATNDSQNPIKLLLGNVDHSSQKDAEAETFTNYGLPFPEIVPLYKIILDTKVGYDNKVRIVSVSKIISRLSTSYNLTEIPAIGTYATVVAAPASATSTGSPGQIAYDNDYFYVCVSTNTWRRVAIGAW